MQSHRPAWQPKQLTAARAKQSGELRVLSAAGGLRQPNFKQKDTEGKLGKQPKGWGAGGVTNKTPEGFLSVRIFSVARTEGRERERGKAFPKINLAN